jgi:hypothetical protein
MCTHIAAQRLHQLVAVASAAASELFLGALLSRGEDLAMIPPEYDVIN